jgi:hypothetical protein
VRGKVWTENAEMVLTSLTSFGGFWNRRAHSASSLQTSPRSGTSSTVREHRNGTKLMYLLFQSGATDFEVPAYLYPPNAKQTLVLRLQKYWETQKDILKVWTKPTSFSSCSIFGNVP